jgi:DNA-binding NtrC family response regulator
MIGGSVVLIVDDEEAIRFAIGRYFERRGLVTAPAETLADARRIVAERAIDAAVVDWSLPDGDGLTLLRELKATDSNLPVVMLTGHATIALAVQTIRDGAEQFLTKPVDLDALVAIVERALRARREHLRVLAEKDRGRRESIDPFVGESAAIRRLAHEASRVAAAPVPVLLLGPTGSGKGVIARWLHEQGPRSGEAFVDLNCAGLSRELLESELFGHLRGAFTGAVANKLGLFEQAHRGTIFLDEIGDLPLDLQPKLLKAVEEKSFRRLGDVQTRRVDVRLVAATHRDLEARSLEGGFRHDLYFRLSTVTLRVPPLAERGRDVLALAEPMLLRLSAELGRSAPTLSPSAQALLLAHAWPGNVRELRNRLERALLMREGGTLEAADFDLAAPAVAGGVAPPSSLREAERRHLELTLRYVDSRVDRAASLLGLSRSALYEKLRGHGIAVRNARRNSEKPESGTS